MKIFKWMSVIVMIIGLTGCSAKYETIQNKDISLKVRSVIVDIDYDSRVVIMPEALLPLPDLEKGKIDPLIKLEK